MPKIVYTNREVIVTVLVALACLAAVFFFPTKGFYQYIMGLAAFLILVPVVFIRLILKKDLTNFGFQIGDWKNGLWGFLIAVIFSIPIVYILINYTDFIQKQERLGIFRGHFADFLYVEVVFSFALILMFEIFFRGFVLFGTKNRLGAWSIAFQFVLALLLMWIIQLFPMGISYLFIVGSFFSGIITYRSRSFVYGLAFNGLLVLIADSIVIKLLK